MQSEWALPEDVTLDRQFVIRSSNEQLLQDATRVAREFAGQYVRDEVVGIVFLGAIARGYFDESADIDLALFKKKAARIPLPRKFTRIEGLEIHCWVSDYEDELAIPWDMARRWTFSRAQVFHDPQGDIARLLQAKVPLRPEEKKQLLMSGLVLSEWYATGLTQLWISRGNIVSAHHVLNQGLEHLFSMLFALNDQLVPDAKWRYYCVERLPELPRGFRDRIRDAMILRSLSPEEVDRRREAFREMWLEVRPVVERELQMTFDEMKQRV